MRENYFNGRPMNYNNWNVFANLGNKNKAIYNNIAPYLSLTNTSSPNIDTKEIGDVLSTAPTQLDAVYTDINTGIDSLGIFDYVYDFNNATDITETETLSWYDSSMQLSNELLDIDNELRITNATYVTNPNIIDGTLQITDIDKQYTLIGELRYGDLSKSYLTTNTQHAEYTLPEANLIISTPLIERIDSNFDLDAIDDDYNWDEVDVDIIKRLSTYDGTNVINYTIALVELREGERNYIRDDYIVRVYASVIVDVYTTEGNLVSSIQYNEQVDSGDLKFNANSSSDVTYESTYIGIDYKFISSIDANNRLLFLITLTGQLEYKFEVDDGYNAYKYEAIDANVLGWVISKIGVTGKYSTSISQLEVGSTYRPNSGERLSISMSDTIPNPQIAQSINGTVMVAGIGYEGEFEFEDDGELEQAGATAMMRIVSLGVNNLGVISSQSSTEISSDLDEDAEVELVIHQATDNINPKIYAYGHVETRRNGEISTPDGAYRSKAVLWECTPGAVTTLQSYDVSGLKTYYKDWEVKLSPNYETNTTELHWRVIRRINDGNPAYYVYNTSELQFNAATNTSAYIYEDRISDGIDWYGVIYTFNRIEDTPMYINMGRQRKYKNISYAGLYDGTDGTDSVSNTFTLYHSLPSGTSTRYISSSL